jgi:hypothetical protein
VATQTFTVLPTAAYTGVRQSPSLDWPASIRCVRFYVVSTDFISPAQGIDMLLEESLDGGTNWKFMASCSSVGGFLDKHGQPAQPFLNVCLGSAELTTPRKVRVG